jgi:multidrug efflux pump
MMCSRLLKAHDPQIAAAGRSADRFHRPRFERLRGGYERWLHGSLNYAAGHAGVRADRAGSIYFLFTTPRPSWRRRRIRASSSRNRSPRRMRRCSSASSIRAGLRGSSPNIPETEHVFQLDVPGPVDRRHGVQAVGPAHATTNELQPVMQQEVNKIAGVRVVAFQPPPLPGSIGCRCSS